MVSFFLFATICLVLCCCYRNIDGYRVNAFHNYENLWEHPVDFDSDEEQIIDVPFVKNLVVLFFNVKKSILNP